MPAVSHVAVIGAAHSERASEPESQQGFRRKPYRPASGHRLSDGSCSRSCRRADGRAFAASRDRANNAADQGATADVLAGALIYTDTLALFLV
jgi:hypothetical protein